MDFLLDENIGDLVFDDTGDFAEDKMPIQFDIKDLIRLNKGNEYHAPHLGAGIYRLLNNNKPEARTSMQQTIRNNMTADGIVSIELVFKGAGDHLTIHANGKR